MKSRDHAGVFVPPPLLYVIPLLLAVMLHSRRPWAISDGYPMALSLGGLFVITLGIAIGLASVFSFRKANTTILPVGRPTTAIVQRGPYRFTRNPMYVAMALGYLGLGPQDPSTPEWGTMLTDTTRYLQTAPHLAIIPGVAIIISVLGFNLIGDGLREALDPKLRGRG